jgi:hypothetical protein
MGVVSTEAGDAPADKRKATDGTKEKVVTASTVG